ncbi:MAG TPA: roadblock/LC7 domain-containing protein [Sandaracinaceae bacterium]
MDELSAHPRGSRTEMLNRILRTLQAESPDIEAAALISEDGLLIATALPQHIEEVRIGGMSATLLALGARAGAELGLGKPEQVLIRGDHGYAVLQTASSGTVLLVIATSNAKLGLVFLDMSRAIKEIKKLI